MNTSAGKIKNQFLIQMPMNERLVKAIGIYPYGSGGREKYSAPCSHSGAKADGEASPSSLYGLRGCSVGRHAASR